MVSPTTAEQVVPGLWCIPVVNELHPGSAELVYAFETNPGKIVLVDPVWSEPSEFQANLASVGFTTDGIEGILLTHIHPDHYRLPSWVRKWSDPWIALHAADAAKIPSNDDATGRRTADAERWLVSAGAPEDEIGVLLDSVPVPRKVSELARPDLHLNDGDRLPIPGWEVDVIHTPGHTPGHSCFRDRRFGTVVTGHHVLPRISPNVSYSHVSGTAPLDDYLTSLEKMRQMSSATALPTREWTFSPLGKRIDELRAHHEARLEEIFAVIRAGAETVWSVAATVTWSRPWAEMRGFARRAALGETHAHLAFLERHRGIVRFSENPLHWKIASPSHGADF